MGYTSNQSLQVEATLVTHKKQLFKHLTVLKDQKRAFANRLHALDYHPQACPHVVASTQAMIAYFEQQIQDTEALLFKDNTDEDNPTQQQMKERILSVVGIGEKSATAIITATNGFANFDNVKQVANFLGVCPDTKESGKSKGRVSIVMSANGYVRKCLFMGAKSALLHNKPCKQLFDRLQPVANHTK